MKKEFNRYLRSIRKRKLRREVFENKRILMLMAIFLNDLMSGFPKDFKLNDYLKESIDDAYPVSRFYPLINDCRHRISKIYMNEWIERIDRVRSKLGFNKIGKGIRSGK